MLYRVIETRFNENLLEVAHENNGIESSILILPDSGSLTTLFEHLRTG